MEGTEGRQRDPVIEGFVDLAVIGRGGSSVVYSARQLSQDRQVAVKVLTDLEESTQRLQRELRALDSLADVPHVVLPYAVVTTSAGNPAVVMPLLGGSLAQRVRDGGPQDPTDVSRWIGQLASCLDQIHQRGIVHRDIKPENVLFTLTESPSASQGSGDVYLVDFGIAGIESVAARTATVMSISPPHAPPERLRGDESQPMAGDLYSLASTAYFALAGHAPFGTMSEGGALGLIERIMSAQLPRDVGVPAPVLDVLERGMSKEPADRYPTARQFAEALAGAVEDSDGITVQRSTFTGPRDALPGSVLGAAPPPLAGPPPVEPAALGGPPPYLGAPPVTTSPELGSAPDREPVVAGSSHQQAALSEDSSVGTARAAQDVDADRRSRRRVAGVGAAIVALILVGAVAVLALAQGRGEEDAVRRQRDRAIEAINATAAPLNTAGEQFTALYTDDQDGVVTYEELGPLVFESISPSLRAASATLEELDPPLTDEASQQAVQARIECLEAYTYRFEREATRDYALTDEENEAEQAAALADADRVCQDAADLREGLKQTA